LRKPGSSLPKAATRQEQEPTRRALLQGEGEAAGPLQESAEGYSLAVD